MGIPVRFIVSDLGVGGILAAISGILLAPIVYVSTQMMDGVLVKGYVGASLEACIRCRGGGRLPHHRGGENLAAAISALQYK